MPLSIKTPTYYPQTTKLNGTSGFFSFMNRSTNSTSDNESKQLKRTSSIQQKSKQHKINGNKRFSADIDLLPLGSIHTTNALKEDIDKIKINYQKEGPSTRDSSTNTTNDSCNISKYIQEGYR